MKKAQFNKLRISHFPRPAVVVASIDNNGNVGAATISWCGVVSSQPPVISVSFLPDSFTRKCIVESREFTINIPDSTLLAETDFLGSISGKWDYKMEKMKEKLNRQLTLNKSKQINSPSIAEFYLNIECRVMNTIQIGLYDCFLGLVLSMSSNDKLYSDNLHPKGDIDYQNVSPIFCLADQYWSTGELLGTSHENKNHPHGNTH